MKRIVPDVTGWMRTTARPIVVSPAPDSPTSAIVLPCSDRERRVVDRLSPTRPDGGGCHAARGTTRGGAPPREAAAWYLLASKLPPTAPRSRRLRRFRRFHTTRNRVPRRHGLEGRIDLRALLDRPGAPVAERATGDIDRQIGWRALDCRELPTTQTVKG